jgi:hypothetical protein
VDLGSDVGNLELRVCEASGNRKLRIVGVGQIKEKMLSGGDPLFEGDVKIEQ